MDRKRSPESSSNDDRIIMSRKRHRLGRRDVDKDHNTVLNNSSDTEEQSDNEIVMKNETKDMDSDSVEGTDNVILLNTQSVEVHAINNRNDKNNNDADNDSDIEIISARDTPVVTIETQDIETAERGGGSGGGGVVDEPNVSVELIDDWYRPEEDVPDINTNANTNSRSTSAINTEPSNEPEHIESEDTNYYEEDDDIIMLDGKPAPTTDELLTQIKQKGAEQSTKTASPTLNIETKKTFKDVICSICMDVIEDAVAAACGHVYCAECIYRALASSKVPGNGATGPSVKRGKCPMCRKVVAYKDLVWLKVRYRKDGKDATKSVNE